MRMIDDIEQNRAEIILNDGSAVVGYGDFIGECAVGDGDEYEDFLHFLPDSGGYLCLTDNDIKSYKLLD